MLNMGDNNKESLANCMEKLKALEQKQRERLAKAICNPSTRFAITPNGIDWEHRRYEIAKELMQGICITKNTGSFKSIAKWSIEGADELIRQLKEKTE